MNFTRIVRRKFCSGTPYHHGFHLEKFEKTNFDYLLAMFEFGRIFLYVYVTAKLFVHTPSLIAFRKTKFLNNPDYALCDHDTYLKFKVHK